MLTDDLVSIPSPSKADEDAYVSLSHTPQGRLIRKKILPMNGSFIHPADHKTKIFVDKNMAQALVNNFNKGYCSTVQVPVVNDNNQHVEDPLRNAGEVIDLDYDDNGVYATIDARKYAEDFGKTILGASAFMHLNYVDTATGQRVGPTLLHVAATNRPHVNGLGDYEDIVKASADISGETKILFMREDSAEQNPTEHEDDEEKHMTREEMLAALKEEHGIDVEALQSEATRAAELSGQLDSLNEQIRLSAGSGDEGDATVTVDDLANALVELSASNKEQATRIETLESANATYAQREAETEVDTLIRTGRVLPKQRDALVRLSMTDRETFDSLIPENALVTLSENGVTVHEQTSHSEERAARVADYVSRAQNRH